MKLNHGDSSQPPDPCGASLDARADGPDAATDSVDRRSSERVEVTWLVDCETEDTFLYASITNISEMGIFVQTTNPLSVGTCLTLRFSPPGALGSYVLKGTVQWVNEPHVLRQTPNPGMGIRFVSLTPEDRERIVDTIRTIAYLRDPPARSN
ncbi:MAG: TIGR02266 family protein [Polyangiaceae bacterium]|nr:TIGR02266 family protein [Polyangiaceae bacterium]